MSLFCTATWLSVSSNFASFLVILHVYIHKPKKYLDERKTEVKGEKKELGAVDGITVF